MNRRPTLPSRRRRAAATTFAAAVALFAAPAAASAADRWVDAETGSDASNNPCTVQANPCKTITQASNTSQTNGDFGTIHVDQGTYPENVNIAQGNFLKADDFVSGDSGSTTIAPTGGGTPLFLQAQASASGFVVTGDAASAVVYLANSARFFDNTVVAKAANSTGILTAGNSSPVIEGNTVIADSGDEDRGITVTPGTVDVRVADNTIGEAGDGFAFGISMGTNATGTIEGNTIKGARKDGGIQGKGIDLNLVGSTTVRGNLITQPRFAVGDESYGMEIEQTPVGSTVKLERNRVLGMSGIGLVVADTGGDVTLDGDLIAGNSDRAMYVGNVPSLSMTNVTVDGIEPIVLNTASVAIDSSILDTEISPQGGAVSCDITHTRGPAITEGGSGCAEFQTTAEPGFVNATMFDYHLTADSPLIDEGNPAAPAPGAVDIDGDPRALEGDGACPRGGERDMGYDEVVKDVADCPVTPDPEVRDTTAPETTVTGERKQFGSRGRFVLSSSEPGSTFECRVDRGQFVPCGAKVKTRRLNLGRHTLFARAIDDAGNADGTPVAMKFKLKPKR